MITAGETWATARQKINDNFTELYQDAANQQAELDAQQAEIDAVEVNDAQQDNNINALQAAQSTQAGQIWGLQTTQTTHTAQILALQNQDKKFYQRIYSSQIPISITWSTLEIAMLSTQIAAGILGVNSRILFRYLTGATGAAGTKTPRLKINWITVQSNALVAAGLSWYFEFNIVNRNALNVQISQPSNVLVQWTSNVALPTYSFDTSLPLNIDFTGQLANAADNFRLESFEILVIND